MKTNRRNFFQTLGAGTAGIGISSAFPKSAMSTPSGQAIEDDEQVLFVGDNIALADTEYGKVKGYILRGINYFLGIPYGAPTSGKNRFMPPQKPKPWDDVLPAVWWGNSTPQNIEGQYSNVYSAFVDHWNYDDISEDCLRLNVFTPEIADGKERPVLVWFHGGGFTAGNGIEQDGYNGENISRKGDIVFVSVNHRLGPMGFSNFAGVGGDKFANSGNVGILDLVAALEWVRDNIENFGGDPGNVTIMGQSGGGGKVKAIAGTPKAKGLFHKAAVLSGFIRLWGEKDTTEKVGEYILREAGITKNEIDKLQQMPWREYYALANRAMAKFAEETGAQMGMGGFVPVVGTEVIPEEPFFPETTSLIEDIPMIFSSTTEEMSPSRTNPELEKITLVEVIEQVKVRAGFEAGLGDKAEEVVMAYAKAFPDKRPVEIWALVSASRRGNVALADSKVKQKAPVYMAWFGWQPPLFNNRMRAFHCLDICFWFDNTDVMYTHTGGGKRPRALAEKVSGSLIQFMNTGDPNGGGLPEWPRYTSENGEVMILNDVCEVKNDPDRKARMAMS
ncbi:carboxylesterase family protein [uncultured Draconibacterium sp.]|uniref:carboxylesterase/lipase family protein n=1 Tax=uncultured Draconibacterium sp. TaxID=1573823 RepID=UPI0029C8FD44|nr:carboxylesterase family protein [uncultured Draconibacterium sp.]